MAFDLWKCLVILPLAMALAACSQDVSMASENSGEAVEAPAEEAPEPLTPEQIRLRATIEWLGAGFGGNAGIAVRDLQTGWTTGFNERGLMPQQSVSKLWVALAILDKADRGQFDMSAETSVGLGDLTVFHQPIRKLVLRDGYFMTTYDDLLHRSITESDNTANDVLLWQAGGPEGVRAVLAAKGLEGIRFGPGERTLQSSIAGLSWRPEYSLGKSFFYAREDLPEQTRRKAFEAYLADPVDGASALAVVDALARLHAGELLSTASTRKLLAILGETKSGPKRLKGGLPEGWTLQHKTGTGQVLGQVHSGYNDVGILTAPSGRSYAVVVMIGSTAVPVPERMDFMHQVVAAIVEYEGSRLGRTSETVSAALPAEPTS